MINGKPSIAIIAEGCEAFAAMAARKLNTKLKLIPPKHAIPKNSNPCSKGLPNKMVKSIKLSPLIKIMSKLL